MPLFLFSLSVEARIDINPMTERIMELQAWDRTVLSEAFVIYPLPNLQWLMPLGDLCEKLDIAVEVSATLGVANGFVISEKRKFNLNLSECKVEHDGTTEKFDCSQVVVYNDDIYVNSNLIQQWFPIKFTVNSPTSTIVFTTREELPFQLRRDRLRRGAFIGQGGELVDHGYPLVPNRSVVADGFFLDEQLTYEGSKALQVGASNTKVAGQLLGVDVTSVLYGSTETYNIETWRLTFSKKDPDSELLGPLHADEYQFFNVVLPALDLISVSKLTTGVYASSYPLLAPTKYSQQDFQGDLPPGWQVELYRNDTLIAQQSSDSTLRYTFTSIPLQYGINRFRLSFYGPQGQLRDEYQIYKVDSSLIRPGTQDYRVALVQSKDSNIGYLLQYEKSIFKNMTAAVALDQLSTQGNRTSDSYAYLKLTGYVDRLLLSAVSAYDNSKGGTGFQLNTQIPLNRVNLGVTYTLLNNFSSEAFNVNNEQLTERLEGLLGFVIPTLPSISINLDLTRDLHLNGVIDYAFKSQLSSQFNSYSLQHQAEYDYQASNGFPTSSYQGTLELKYSFFGKYLKFDIQYGFTGIQTLSEQLQLPFHKDLYVLGLTTRQLLATNDYDASGTLTRDFQNVKLSTNLVWASNGQNSINFLLTLNLARDPHKENWHLDSRPMADFGAVSVSTFIDQNLSGQFDSTDKPMPKVKILKNNNTAGFTDEKGALFLPQLPPYQPVEFTIAEDAFDDPFLKSSLKGLKVIPRPGIVTHFDFPVIYTGLIEGIVWKQNGKAQASGRRGVEVELINLKGEIVSQVKSGTDGIFSMPDIRPGKYILRLSSKQLQKLGLQVVAPAEQSILIPPEGTVESGHEFTVR